MMFSFVESLFIKKRIEDTASETSGELSTSKLDESASASKKCSYEEACASDISHHVAKVTPSAQSDSSENSNSEASDYNINTQKPTLFNARHSPKDVTKTFKGSLFLVDGNDFECLMPGCDIKIDKTTLKIHATDDQKAKTPSILTIKIFQIRLVVQKLANAFQFIVLNAKGESGTEYGIQINPSGEGLVFRQFLYESIVSAASEMISVECALAEYSTKDKEFVILSKSATAVILQSPSCTDYYIAFFGKDLSDHSKNEYYIIDFLSKDIQIWGSPTTNQITFWSTHHKSFSMNKTMFLMEINPEAVGEATTNLFFLRLAYILQDRSFLRSQDMCSDSHQDFRAENFIQDDDFDLGDCSDNGFCLEWRHGRRSTVPRHRKSYFSAQSECSDSNTSEIDPLYNPPNYPRYSSDITKDILVHRFMEVGAANTFVCRGTRPTTSFGSKQKSDNTRLQLKLYRRDHSYDDEGILQSVGVIDGEKFSHDGKAFVPIKGLLHQQEKKMLLVPETGEKGDVYMMDLETEKVVQKWNSSKTPIATMFSTFKKGQESMDPTFLCANPRELFLMDTRMRDEPAKTVSYSYATNPQLSVGVTDSSGHILLGSRLGELRLFDGNANAKGDFKRAKTLLQAVKEPIIAVDVNHDGSWILATTKTFLVVFPTRLANSDKTGFDVPLGKKKPPARYLMLSADDMLKYQITAIDFSPAKFDATEESIVTSTGNMAVVWDFASVKRGQPFYSVRFAEDTIKDVQVPNNSANVVVAYPTAIGLFGTEKHRF